LFEQLKTDDEPISDQGVLRYFYSIRYHHRISYLNWRTHQSCHNPTQRPHQRNRLFCLVGLGFGAPPALIIAGVQLSTPYHLIATATALTTSSRAVASATFTAIYSATVSDRLAKYIPGYIAEAALRAGLPKSPLPAFVSAFASNNATAPPSIPGVTPVVIDSGVNALKQAFADGIRAVFMIAAPFRALACVACFFLSDMKATVNYHVDAPMEDLHAKHHHEEHA
jgi:hypothetical protein